MSQMSNSSSSYTQQQQNNIETEEQTFEGREISEKMRQKDSKRKTISINTQVSGNSQKFTETMHPSPSMESKLNYEYSRMSI